MENVTTLAGTAHSIRVGVQADVVRLAQVDRANVNGTFIFGSDVLRDRVRQSESGRQRRAERDLRSRSVPPRRLPARPATARRNSPSSRATRRSHCRSSRAPCSRRTTGGWRRRLTVSYGIRHEIQQYDGLRMRFAPRAGLAWAPAADGNSAVRVGVGALLHADSSRGSFPTRCVWTAATASTRRRSAGVLPGRAGRASRRAKPHGHDSHAVTGSDLSDDARLDHQLRSPACREPVWLDRLHVAAWHRPAAHSQHRRLRRDRHHDPRMP